MKRLALVLSIFALCFTAQSRERRGILPRTKKLSSESVNIANILVNSQIKNCLEAIEDRNYDFSIEAIKKSELGGRRTRYEFSGVALMDGDVAVGLMTLTVLEQKLFGAMGEGWGSRLTCEVAIPRPPMRR